MKKLLVLLWMLSLPCLAMFESACRESRNRLYTARKDAGQVKLQSKGQILWTLPDLRRSYIWAVSDRGLVSLEDGERMLYLDRGGRRLRSGPLNRNGWFSQDGTHYFAYHAAQPQLLQLTLSSSQPAQPAETDLLLQELRNPEAPGAQLLVEMAARKVTLSPALLGELELIPELSRQVKAWRRRPAAARLDDLLLVSPEAYWERACHQPPAVYQLTLGALLDGWGARAQTATARALPQMGNQQASAVLSYFVWQYPQYPLNDLEPVLVALLQRPALQPFIFQILRKHGAVTSLLPFLNHPEGRAACLSALCEVRHPEAAARLVSLLDQPNLTLPERNLAIKALRFQARVSLGDDPAAWKRWFARSSHGLESRLAEQSHRQLPGFLLASWEGLLSRRDFVDLPRLINPQAPYTIDFAVSLQGYGPDCVSKHQCKNEIYGHRYVLGRGGRRHWPIAGPWKSVRRTSDGKHLLASYRGRDRIDRLSLLDLKGKPLTPLRSLRCPSEMSPSGTYVVEPGNPRVGILNVLSGMKTDLSVAGPYRLAFAPDDSRLLVITVQGAQIYRLPQVKLEAELPLPPLADEEAWLTWKSGQLLRGETLYQWHAMPTAVALLPQNQRLLAELWTGHRLQGGRAVALTPAQWKERQLRWHRTFRQDWVTLRR